MLFRMYVSFIVTIIKGALFLASIGAFYQVRDYYRIKAGEAVANGGWGSLRKYNEQLVGPTPWLPATYKEKEKRKRQQAN